MPAQELASKAAVRPGRRAERSSDPIRIRPLLDRSPSLREFLRAVLDGLSQTPRSLPCKYFYDAAGSRLFDRICELEEYYLTRTEIDIMRRCAAQMASCLGPGCQLIECGSGSSVKTRFLLDRLPAPAAYVPIDISCDHLAHSAAALAAGYPELEVLPLCADYTEDFELPRPRARVQRRAVYFPGSTIGNLTPERAASFLGRLAALGGRGGALLIGVDLQKEAAVIEPAYNDAAGVTAAFNLNLLRRINRELGADFELEAWAHRAFYDQVHGRIEMHLVSRRPQVVTLDRKRFSFERGETIRTEYSYKHSLEGFAALAAGSGFQVEQVWTDASGLFSVQYLTVR
jgi:dimethylhistidine N-methyltransferase